MNVVYKGLSKLKNIYNQINPATLTGALDIIVVEQPDGLLLASPFHVRFGKLGVLQTREKVVNISINGEPVAALQMKLGDQGEAFFVIDIDEDDEISPCLITSPLPSRPSTPHQILDDEDDDEDMNESDKGDNGSAADALTKQQRKRRKKRKRKSQQQQCGPPSPAVAAAAAANGGKEQIEVAEFRDDTVLNSSSVNSPCGNSRTSSQSSTDSFMNMKSDSLRRVLSDSELPENNNKSIVESSCLFEQPGKQHKLEWGWGQLPDENMRDSSGDEDRSTTDNKNQLVLDPPTPTHDEAYDSSKHFKSLSLSEEAEAKCVKEENPTSEVGDKKSATEHQQQKQAVSQPQPRQRNQSEGLYLDDVLSLHPSQADLYLKVKAANVMGGESGVPPTPTAVPASERPLSPGPPGSDVDSGTDCNESEPSGLSVGGGAAVTLDDVTDIAVSLCGFVAGSQQPDEGKFDEKRVDFDQFLSNPMSVMSDPDVVVRINSRCYTWQQALPMIVSLAVFKRPLSQSFIDRLVDSATPPSTTNNSSSPTTPATQQAPQQQSSRTWNWLWRRKDKDMNKNVSESDSINEGEQRQQETATSDNNASTEQEVAVIMDPTDLSSSPLEETVSGPLLDSNKEKQEECDQLHPNNTSTNKSMRKTIRLTSEQLGNLDLKEGANTITFSVTTQFQGTKRCCAHIYKWKWHDRVVISDIDGTITKSDVFGQILPVVGKDWTQGGIANLYHNISKNGYKFIYLSARAIGQASMTKDYLQWINQHGKTLPPGPLLLSPTSLISAFRREVIEKKPEKFKIECLKDIKALFPIGNPFYAGFGNKTSDVTSYTAVEIADDRMFTINHRGELKQEKLPTYTTTLSDLGEVVDNFFPFVADIQSTSSLSSSSTLCSYLNDVCGVQQRHKSFTDFSYWRSDLPSLTDEDLKLIKAAN